MPKSYVPVPDGYIIWRDNDGMYSVAVKPVPLRSGLHSRTQAADYLWRMLGIRRLIDLTRETRNGNAVQS